MLYCELIDIFSPSSYIHIFNGSCSHLKCLGYIAGSPLHRSSIGIEDGKDLLVSNSRHLPTPKIPPRKFLSYILEAQIFFIVITCVGKLLQSAVF